ncbi:MULTISPECIES: serine protease [unclassified Moorena]|uniref:S1 family peptidase n=1 Tax=unclassified Moorena TaxID=2683338 RepID=UPI0014018C83|nr:MULTISPECIES: serine protease [unclassified Moorena]NEO13524.1 trypsin-like peptidase domain-containing protein [Moorena sp. SIO3E8]NEP98519.1 trypsin-like peptidase domain-containing protein [Moorena sp. SIO3F7]
MANQTTNSFEGFKTSIVRIYHSNGAVVGAGFLVSNGYLLTCAHVITEALGILQTTQDAPTEAIHLDFPLIAPGQKLTATVVFWKPVSETEVIEDIAGLRLNSKLPDSAQPVQLVTAQNLWNHLIRVFGFPKGHDHGVWASAVLRDKNAKGWLQIEDIKVPGYQVERGFSGAPVWDDQLAGVVGMAVAAEKRRENVKAGFLVPTQVLNQFWSELGQLGEIFNNSKRLTPGKRRRLQQDLEDLQELYDLGRARLRKLRKERAIANDPSTELKLDVKIEEEQGELDKLELQIEEIEEKLG